MTFRRPSWEQIAAELRFHLIPVLVAALARFIARTVRLKVIGEEVINEREQRKAPAIIISWHGRTLLPVVRYGPRRWAAMVSLSRDGEYQARIFQRLGWEVVRGSSGRGGVRALAAAVKKLRQGTLFGITPDGPKGPSHQVQPGVLFLAQKSGGAICPIGVSAYPRVLLPTWDGYLIPLPFSRGAMVCGEAVIVPPDATEEQLDLLAEDLSHRICELENAAEALVTPPSARIRSVPYSEPGQRVQAEGQGRG